MRKGISLDEMREKAGPAIFGDDLLGETSSADRAVLEKFGPSTIGRPGGMMVPQIERCPRNSRIELDRALGRFYRRIFQGATIDTWIEDQGLPVDPKIAADRSIFNRALRDLRRDESAQRGPGRPADVLERVTAAMRADLDSGKTSLQDFARLREKQIAAAYDCSRGPAEKARKLVLAERRN